MIPQLMQDVAALDCIMHIVQMGFCCDWIIRNIVLGGTMETMHALYILKFFYSIVQNVASHCKM
jgi:hypothetical protein